MDRKLGTTWYICPIHTAKDPFIYYKKLIVLCNTAPRVECAHTDNVGPIIPTKKRYSNAAQNIFFLKKKLIAQRLTILIPTWVQNSWKLKKKKKKNAKMGIAAYSVVKTDRGVNLGQGWHIWTFGCLILTN